MSKSRKIIAHEVELHRLPLTGIADGRHATFVGRRFLGCRIAGAQQVTHDDAANADNGTRAQHHEQDQPACHEELSPVLREEHALTRVRVTARSSNANERLPRKSISGET